LPYFPTPIFLCCSAEGYLTSAFPHVRGVIFPDTAGQAYTKNVSLSAGLMAWQKASASYGTQQGFSVTSK